MTLSPGFSQDEAQQTLSLCANIYGPSDPPLKNPPLPVGWRKVFEPAKPVPPFNTLWQLWRQGDRPKGPWSLVFRGTVNQPGSIIEDLISVMIPAQGSLKVGDLEFDYKLAEDPLAGVHLGFTLGLASVLPGILLKLGELSLGGKMAPDADLFITGHSQGAAVATLCRSFFEYSSLNPVKDAAFKTYVYAQPKPGNDHYAYDFDRIASQTGYAFRVSNNLDWVPQAPFTIELPRDWNTPNPFQQLGLLLKGQNGDQARLEQSADAFLEDLKRRQLGRMTAYKSNADLSSLKILKTLNFEGSGAPHTLVGKPGHNPCDPPDDPGKDFFWQHHAALYYLLLTGQAVPTTCN